ncbi:hypothetical protein T10_8309 [Trichinella papuae]|uniref:Secreted protein n=1 Tax=Trichinella papuae TaxID=268474 RepID=A0A0V1M2B0_9BILA|nr:hypothetical protein T10_8309 [Trichinella papuae]
MITTPTSRHRTFASRLASSLLMAILQTPATQLTLDCHAGPRLNVRLPKLFTRGSIVCTHAEWTAAGDCRVQHGRGHLGGAFRLSRGSTQLSTT